MFLCKVVGSVVSQQKEDCLIGKKMLLCETMEGKTKTRLVAVDLVGAGPGSEVLVSRRYGGAGQGDFVDDWIVGIVDTIAEQQ